MNNDPSYEKLGLFYLGREKQGDSPYLLYDAQDLTTHAMIVGMTGSGKTGLAVSLIEEAAIDGIPSILIDPKGDLSNLLLQFPELRPADFRPWIDPEEARRKGTSPDALADSTAALWQKGLGKWDQSGDRIRRLSESAEFSVYTPGDTSGRPLCILRSFDAPKGLDGSALRDRILYTVSSLLGLLGTTDDSTQSREHVFLSNVFDAAWRKGQSLTIEKLIDAIKTPPFEKVGFIHVDDFFPAADRAKFALSINALAASPGFSAWMEGEPLDAESLLHTPDGRPRVSILSIAHLSDSERMFFVTALLNEVLSWMRRQKGTNSLRALLYMDEIYGYFPPSKNPPCKGVMLTLLKQARAFGLGIVLSTQNPVDLDYKGLSNCGTWFVGRLQTERDKLRILDGLASAADASAAVFDRAQADKLLSGLANRTFFLRNVHDDASVLFETRWAMSYLAGPLTLAQIQTLCTPAPETSLGGSGAEPPSVADAATSATSATPATSATSATSVTSPAASRPVVPDSLHQYRPAAVDSDTRPSWHPMALGVAKLHYANATAKVDFFLEKSFLCDFDDEGNALWDESDVSDGKLAIRSGAPAASSGDFEPLPAGAIGAKTADQWTRSFKAYVYEGHPLELFRYAPAKLISEPGESEGAFRARAVHADRERMDAAKAKIVKEYETKLQSLDDKIRTAEARVEREKDTKKSQWLSTAVSMGSTILGALLGRRGNSVGVGTVTRAGSTLRSASRISKKAGDVQRAEDSLEVLVERRKELDRDYEEKLAAIPPVALADDIDLETLVLRPKKADIVISALGLYWQA